MLIQLIATTKTGKDSLYKTLHSLGDLGWEVYGNNKLCFPVTNTCRIAFADKLKIMVCKELKIDQIDNPSTVNESIIPTIKMSSQEWVENNWIDIIKDLSPQEINLPLQGKTFRSWLENYADQKKKNFGFDYFINLVANDVNNKLKKNVNVFITDTRYPYEVFGNAVTIRLFRSDVPIVNTHSERSMDNYKCSYVFCKNDKDFEILCTMQPQYMNYTFQGSLASCACL
jgi:hypothetical protein